jgi:preprotein translocase subunit SecD
MLILLSMKEPRKNYEMENHEAVKASYSWTGAMRSIVDANVTHILIGAVLFIFGSGPKVLQLH